MNNVVGELCLLQDDPGGKQHQLNKSRQQGREVLEGEDMSSTSFTDQQFMSLQSFNRTFSGSLINISKEHKELLYECPRKPPGNFYSTGFSHTKVINSRLLVGTFYKQICLVLDVKLDRKSAELGFTHFICKPNTLKEDQQQEDPIFHLVENVVPNYQLHNLNDIDCNSKEWQLLLQKRKEYSQLQGRKEIRGAIACLFIDGDLCKCFYVAMPLYKKKTKQNNIHYEELLIGQIGAYLKISQESHNGAPKGGGKKILIYIPKSPCFKREKETIKPCFFLLLENAALWKKKYNYHTHVGFTHYFGPLSSRILDKIPKLEILRTNSVFHAYTEKSDNDRTKLNWEEIKKKIYAMNKEKMFQEITDFKKCLENLCNLAKSELTLNQHLKCVREIKSSGFDSAVKDSICKTLCTIWEEAVENKRLELIKEKFKADYNEKFVTSFLKHQNFSSGDDFLQFVLIEKQHLSTNMLQSDLHSLDDKNLRSPDGRETVISD
ncbi:uncharacterized protein LOC111573438 [Amphiprion ocellaris]|uniref:uncharacterized protein LOC111573438 n=1 Tax=Amphiprion ocellaris TaxID=80972 RepID=UPI0024115C16|nr:uncharacterized protein LOC111573438 [Amphiprion ocellaris]